MIETGISSKDLHLRYQMSMLFITLLNMFPNRSWKTLYDNKGESYSSLLSPIFGGGWFLAGITTPQGTYALVLNDTFWDICKCPQVDHARLCQLLDDDNVSCFLSLCDL